MISSCVEKLMVQVEELEPQRERRVGGGGKGVGQVGHGMRSLRSQC